MKINQLIEWNETTVGTLKDLWPTHTARHIATELGTTRNAVIGKARRLKLKSKESVYHKTGRPLIPAIAVPVPKKRIKAVKPHAKNIKAYSCKTVTFHGVSDKTCRWILGEPNGINTLYCGCATGKDKPYCEEHTDTATRKV